MLLAEALIMRSDLENRINTLKRRMERFAKAPEGETPDEDASQLLTEVMSALAEQTGLIGRINRTNAGHILAGGQSLMDALLERDLLGRQVGVLDSLIDEATTDYRWHTSGEAKLKATVKVKELQSSMDHLAQKRRERDLEIQAANWTVHLVE